MKRLRIAAAAGLGLLALAASPALAAPVNGYVTANVNERSGPSTSYPPIVVIPAGSPITIYGCLTDDSWCDISWGPNRGWMSSNYLQVSYQSRRLPVRGYSGIPFITFNFGTYWDSHYRNRPFFNQRSKWSNFHWQNGGQNPWPKNPMPPKPPKFPNNGQFGNGQNGQNGQFGNGQNGQYGNGQNGQNGQGYNNGQNGKYGKNCKWINGKWVCM
ncbi:MAG TPA: SH3 domain-containing protein [Bauldia sp.]|nr:SH3 domain-containing protein [Bauldia sp.]